MDDTTWSQPERDEDEDEAQSLAWDEDAGDALDDGAGPGLAEDDAEHVSTTMFEGDASTLFPEQRHCLHALMKHRYLSAERHPAQWSVLLQNEDVLRGRLNDLFLDLYVDREHQVAFKRPAAADGPDPLPSLLRNVAHTKEETIVMMALRQRLFARRQEGDDVVYVERDWLLDEIGSMRPDHATNRAMDAKRAANALDSLATAGVLLRTEDPDRFRIAPIVEVLLPVEKLRALLDWLSETNGASDGAEETGPGADRGDPRHEPHLPAQDGENR